jgi:hypothetical protein
VVNKGVNLVSLEVILVLNSLNCDNSKNIVLV